MTTREERDQLRALAEAATPGPWSLPSGPECVCTWHPGTPGIEPDTLEYEPACPVHSEHVYNPRTQTWEFAEADDNLRWERDHSATLRAERDEARLLMGDWAARAGAAEAERDDLAAAVERVRNGLADLTTDIATDAGDDAATYGAEYYAGMVTVATRIMCVVRALDGADQ